MAVTTTILGSNELRAYPDSPAPFPRLFEVAVQISGTYLTAAKPNFNILAALQNAHMGVKTVTVIGAGIIRDRYDGTNRYTAQVALASVNAGCVNDKVTATIQSGATDGGAGGSEVADGTTVTGTYTFYAVAEIVAE